MKVRKANPVQPTEGSRVDKFVKERQEIKKLVEHVRALAPALSLFVILAVADDTCA